MQYGVIRRNKKAAQGAGTPKGGNQVNHIHHKQDREENQVRTEAITKNA